MCIAILNNGNELTRDELANCWISNDDGAGMLFIENNKLVACKYPNADGYGKAGESFNEFYADYREIYKRSVDNNTPVLLHFRIATHGFDPAYLHPFFISDNVGMIHNGIIDGYGSKDVSDTAEFSQELATLPSTMLGDVSFLEIPFVYNMIYLAIGTYNKLVFMDDKGQWTIFNEDKGHWVGDNWFSNDSYKSLNRLLVITATLPKVECMMPLMMKMMSGGSSTTPSHSSRTSPTTATYATSKRLLIGMLAV